ncbi:hypothetical protein IG631_14257 [Alternaria alternata]|nr:hypothetical protein IG631_14257 [Alternaria alternata]
MDHVFVNAPRAQEDGYHSMNTTANTVMRNGDNELEKAPYTQGPPNSEVPRTPVTARGVGSGCRYKFNGLQEGSTRESCSVSKDDPEFAHSKRKAQNRAALVLALKRVCTEKEILHATIARFPTSSPQASINSPVPVIHLSDEDSEDLKGIARSLDITKNVGSANLETRGDETPTTEAWYRTQSCTLASQRLTSIADLHERLKGPEDVVGCPVAFQASATPEAVYESKRGARPEPSSQSGLGSMAWPYFPF